MRSKNCYYYYHYYYYYYYSSLHLSRTRLSRTSLYFEPNLIPLGFDWYFLCYLPLFISSSLISNLHFSRTISFSLWYKNTFYISIKPQKLLVDIKKRSTKDNNMIEEDEETGIVDELP